MIIAYASLYTVIITYGGAQTHAHGRCDRFPSKDCMERLKLMSRTDEAKGVTETETQTVDIRVRLNDIMN